MLDTLDLYQAMLKRHNISLFKQDLYPEKHVIETIIDESLKLTPVFNNNWHHKIDVYGPEYAAEKKKLCLSTVENTVFRSKYDTRNVGDSGIKSLEPRLDAFIQAAEQNKLRVGGFAEMNTSTSFNLQVMAPYLLKFSHSFNHFVLPSEANKDTAKGMTTKGIQSSMAQAYAIATIANHYDVDCGFCGCVIFNDENVNDIWYNDNQFIFFVALGYKHPGCFDSPGSKHYPLKRRPTMSDIVEWN